MLPHTTSPNHNINIGPFPDCIFLQTPAMTGESSSKLLSHLTSTKTASNNPLQTISVPGCGGINDAAFCPDGSKLAVACRDGSVRLLDWPSGVCVGGYQVRLSRVSVVDHGAGLDRFGTLNSDTMDISMSHHDI